MVGLRYYRRLLCFLTMKFLLCFASFADDHCRTDQQVNKLCEPLCVVQVELSIVRVTFNEILIRGVCVLEANVVYWKTNNESISSKRKSLATHDAEIYSKDCTYHMHNLKVAKQKQTELLNPQEHLKPPTAFNLKDNHATSDKKYIYLFGLAQGETYSFKAEVLLNQMVEGRRNFSSVETTLTLSRDSAFSTLWLGTINQGSCCNITSITHRHSISKHGKCVQTTSRFHPLSEIIIVLCVVFFYAITIVIIILYKVRDIIKRKRYVVTTRGDYGDHILGKETPIRCSPVSIVRSLPDGEEFAYEISEI